MSTKIAMERIKKELRKGPVHSATLSQKILAPDSPDGEFLRPSDYFQGIGTLMTKGVVIFGPDRELVLVEEDGEEDPS